MRKSRSSRYMAGALALLAATLLAPPVHAYPAYNDGFGVGCVQCHNGFQGGTGVLHNRHRIEFGVATCNLCHPSGAGTTPVNTYWSGSGGGYGCAGCHGQDYGETSPNSGQPKATAYGLRLYHVAQGETSCGTGFCHQPGQLGHPNPFPAPYTEDVAPPYYSPVYSNLTDPCSSDQEDITADGDVLGLDNDGNGQRDYPADSNCAAPADTFTPTVTPTLAPPTPTPTLGVSCGTAPALTCIAPEKGSLIIDEKTAGKEKLKVTLSKLQPAVSPGQFGDPVAGTTAYKVCVYDAADQLRGDYTLARAGQLCDGDPCWTEVTGKGFKYKDKAATANGFTKMQLLGGDPGKGKVKAMARNSGGALPLGVAALMQNETGATVQVLTSNATCFGIGLSSVKKADGLVFSAKGP